MENLRCAVLARIVFLMGSSSPLWVVRMDSLCSAMPLPSFLPDQRMFVFLKFHQEKQALLPSFYALHFSKLLLLLVGGEWFSAVPWKGMVEEAKQQKNKRKEISKEKIKKLKEKKEVEERGVGRKIIGNVYIGGISYLENQFGCGKMEETLYKFWKYSCLL